MNLAHVLDEALPDVPALRTEERFPRIHPKLVVREYQDRDGLVIMCMVPGGRPPYYFRFNQYQYLLASLFDGERSYDEVAAEYNRRTGANLSGEQVKGFAAGMSKVEFWYKSPEEESACLCHELMSSRRKAVKKKRDWGDLSSITFVEFDPSGYIEWVYKHFSWVYSRRFLLWSAFMLLVATLILGSHWHEVWNDSIQFYDLLGKGASHAALFFTMFFSLGAIHETAHGLTCRHFGGTPHRMGAFTIYLVPAIFCDVSEVWVYGGRWQRLATVVAGVLSEIIVACYATVIWWVTPPGTFVHTACYMIILSGGIFCAVVNWNPLSKMDGYYLFSEYYRFHDIKGQSTSYCTAWVRNKIFRMPIEIPKLPYPRNIVYPIYGVLSGIYCYFMLTFLSRLAYHVFTYYSARWAIVPAGIVAAIIFSTRIRMLVTFMKEFYRHKLPLVKAHWPKYAAITAAIILAGLLPVRREYVEERFTLEPVQHAVLNAEVNGRIDAVRAREGDRVSAGQPLVHMHDLMVATRVAANAANQQEAFEHTVQAQLGYGDLAAAQQVQLQYAVAEKLEQDRARRLDVRSPISGIVVTPRTEDLLGTYAKEGSRLMEVADTSRLRARVYVPEPEMRKLNAIAYAVLYPDNRWWTVPGKVAYIAPVSELPPGATPSATADYAGVSDAAYFDVQVLVDNAKGSIPDGMTGTIKIFGRRRGLLPTMLQPVWDGISRRVW